MLGCPLGSVGLCLLAAARPGPATTTPKRVLGSPSKRRVVRTGPPPPAWTYKKLNTDTDISSSHHLSMSRSGGVAERRERRALLMHAARGTMAGVPISDEGSALDAICLLIMRSAHKTPFQHLRPEFQR
ncbi:hypothetical protein L227DRAFT_575289 [Lentinus tigrinus ALCF2SS1-6]|uniref:Secreted protein n=1 Tax=Lentinus tigrinus ALCF2SS1-6 TaxID=1328759 RepID=A0A5C2S8K5_9APHY|nr:hypothetical protein L227DRAFT_575289 [Lentinus tigrinus ALCF2SS1-6]